MDFKMTNLRLLVAQNIKKYRKIRGFSQEALAEKAGTSTTHIGMIEIGKKFPSVKMMERIAEALGIDTPELFSTENVIFVSGNQKSIERMYQDIIRDLESLAQKFKERSIELH